MRSHPSNMGTMVRGWYLFAIRDPVCNGTCLIDCEWYLLTMYTSTPPNQQERQKANARRKQV